MIRSYRDLRVWQEAVDLSIECYRVSKRFPKEELYGLISQARRAAVSVAANIAEGHGRKQLGDYLQHLSIARGSLMELETHLAIAEKLGFIAQAELESLLSRTDSVSRMSSGLITTLRGSTARPRTPHRAPRTESAPPRPAPRAPHTEKASPHTAHRAPHTE